MLETTVLSMFREGNPVYLTRYYSIVYYVTIITVSCRMSWRGSVGEIVIKVRVDVLQENMN